MINLSSSLILIFYLIFLNIFFSFNYNFLIFNFINFIFIIISYVTIIYTFDLKLLSLFLGIVYLGGIVIYLIILLFSSNIFFFTRPNNSKHKLKQILYKISNFENIFLLLFFFFVGSYLFTRINNSNIIDLNLFKNKYINVSKINELIYINHFLIKHFHLLIFLGILLLFTLIVIVEIFKEKNENIPY